MSKALKTAASKASVRQFINDIANEEQREDAKTLVVILKNITGQKPVVWGDSIVGFDSYRYTRNDKSEHEFFLIGFSPRKQNLSIHILPGYQCQNYSDLLERLGPYKLGKSCLYIKRLSDIHLPTLKKLLTKGYRDGVKQLK